MIQVIIIAPGIASRAGLRALLSEDQQISVIGEAAELNMQDNSTLEADVLVWLPGSVNDVSESVPKLNKGGDDSAPALLIISDDPQLLHLLMQQPVKAWGLLSPEAAQAELIAGVQAVNEGLTVIHPHWVSEIARVPGSSSNGNEKSIEELTSRELEILELLALGLTNKQIAARLKISAHTVKFHISTIYGKLGTTNRVETVNLGLKKGLVVL